ncbi:hypothetical protein KS4_33630 [Poriferisphaera corsica]|uniref:Uncharacterized protein n=1 Tax=Poriferisphaera corsica TaxID=2528020 RepID=A0A517YYH4_9BACT|nr:hypothetical protein [Poriferisphaera corsica]QDU35282.1 hypothetical protein KS4_33630 [Poriferisphaera corsica]
MNRWPIGILTNQVLAALNLFFWGGFVVWLWGMMGGDIFGDMMGYVLVAWFGMPFVVMAGGFLMIPTSGAALGVLVAGDVFVVGLGYAVVSEMTVGTGNGIAVMLLPVLQAVVAAGMVMGAWLCEAVVRYRRSGANYVN